MLTAQAAQELVPLDVEQVESFMLTQPQVECPVVHHFGPGTYTREVTMYAGTTAVGHHQRFPQLNVMLTGKVAMIQDDKTVTVLEAPLIFVGEPGRKIGHVMETCTWLNVYPNPDNERNVDVLEDRWLDKSTTFRAFQEVRPDIHADDRADFLWLIDKAGFDEATVRAQSENEVDQIPMPDGYGSYLTVRTSPIEGQGIFVTLPFQAKQTIGPARIDDKRTPLGRYVNHSKTPNCEYFKYDGDIWLRSLRSLHGCLGGNPGEELTVDYAQALSLSGIEIKRGEFQ